MSGWDITPDDPTKRQRATLYKWTFQRSLVALLTRDDAGEIIGVLASKLGDITPEQKAALMMLGFPSKAAGLLSQADATRMIEILKEAWSQVIDEENPVNKERFTTCDDE